MVEDEDEAPIEGAEDDGTSEEPTTSVRTRATLGLGERSVTLNMARISKSEREEAKTYLPIYEEYADQRPKTREDCKDGQRPCPWVSCKYNNYLEVKEHGPTAGRAIILNFPDLEPEDVPPERSCALDVADEGGSTLEDVAVVMNLTRERVRQIQEKAEVKLRRSKRLSQFCDGDEKLEGSGVGGMGISRSRLRSPQPPTTPVEEDEEDDDLTLGDGESIRFTSDHPKADQIVSARIWRIYMRESVEHGFAKRKLTKRELEGLPDVPLDERFAETNIEDDLSMRHNRGMTHEKTKASDLTERQQKVLAKYNDLEKTLGQIPNNVQIAKALRLEAGAVTRDRQVLIAAGLAKPAPRGKTSIRNPDKVKRPEHAKPVRQSKEPSKVILPATAKVRVLVDNPIDSIVATIDAQIASLDAQRERLIQARTLLTDSA